MKIEFQTNLKFEGDKCQGLYFHREETFKRLIQIEKNLPPLHKLAVIIHELIHYLIDIAFNNSRFLHNMLDKFDIDIW